MTDSDKAMQMSIKHLGILIGAILTIIGASTAALGYVFASKSDLQVIELKLADTGSAVLTEWRIKTLEVKQSNLLTRQQKMDANLTSLLGRFRVAVAPEPVYIPLPEPPKPGSEK